MTTFTALMKNVRACTHCALHLPHGVRPVLQIDLAPRSECAVAWREQLLEQLSHLEFTLVIGKYAQSVHLPESKT